ncbi:MAG: D-inositol 3-phosphate glycosyltransferase [Chloroflexi bacterium ADurb.Bin344]|nr:MAG: D-inositol 3-phosphate glycosyltransferase [Chloroflexi bacterium ADurb.Bin344]
MKIAIIANIFNPVGSNALGGLEQFSYNLASELYNRGENVSLYASGDSEKAPFLKPIVPLSLQFSKSEEYLAVPWNYRKITVEEFAAFTKLIQEIDGETIVHFNLVNFLPLYLAAKRKLKTLTTLHMSTSNAHFEIIQRLLSGEEVDKLNFIGVSKRQMTGYRGKFHLIHHGVNLEQYSFSSSPKKNSYVWIGRMVKEKGLDAAIDAANKSGVSLAVGGEAKLANEVEYFKSIKHLFTDNIKNSGYITIDKKSEFYSAKATIFSSLMNEAFGLTIIESMACGTPVIAYKTGAAEEIIEDGVDGYLVEQGDIKGIYDSIQKIESMNTDDYLKMRNRCREKIENKFDFKKMVDHYLKIYKQL